MAVTEFQPSLSDAEYSQRRRTPKREEFLNRMDQVVPWTDWTKLIEPHYYSNTRGRKAGTPGGAVGDDAADVPAAGVVPPVR